MSNSTRATQSFSNSAGVKLALHAYPAEHNRFTPVVLAHGTFSNHRSCQGLAQYLALAGFNCWVLEFQGHGSSGRPVVEPDFETMCLQDTQAAIDFIGERYPDRALNWVGHSGGGLAILMYLARHPEQLGKVNQVVTLASQCTDAAIPWTNRMAIRASAVVTSLLGFAPGKMFKLGPENEYARVMQQWYNWSLRGRWLGSDGFDYEHALSLFPVPCLTLAAAADNFIAPASGCKRLHDNNPSEHKAYRVCGVQSGFLEDYTHSRLISSRNASRDIWPLIKQRLQTQLHTDPVHMVEST